VSELSAAARHTYFQCDVGSSARCAAAVQHTISELGKIDFVFNCAGINPTALAITDTTDEYFDKLVNTNLRGPYNITRSVVPHLKTGAAIVNVSSTAGLRATNGFSIVNSPTVYNCGESLEINMPRSTARQSSAS
jgi:NAD(P)-dependent dehydrogenase (short-subunit alcohol dehydrogenase family)